VSVLSILAALYSFTFPEPYPQILTVSCAKSFASSKKFIRWAAQLIFFGQVFLTYLSFLIVLDDYH